MKSISILPGLVFLVLALGATIASPDSESAVWGTDRCENVSCRFKSPNPETPNDVRDRWSDEDKTLWKFVEEKVPDVLEHTGAAAFDEHLKGVQAVLRYWDAPIHLTKAGLFHSIYGTEGFQGFALPLTQRAAIQSLIGPEAEKLAFVFCMIDRSTLDQTVMEYYSNYTQFGKSNKKNNVVFHLRARPELGRFPIELTKDEWMDFVELTLADWLEQVEGAAETASDIFLWKFPGHAYAYRRVAYKTMSQILAVERAPRLAVTAPRMLKEVMETESESTRHLQQPRTPPMSKAAAEALAALRSVGEDIPEDLSPQPPMEAEECELQEQTRRS